MPDGLFNLGNAVTYGLHATYTPGCRCEIPIDSEKPEKHVKTNCALHILHYQAYGMCAFLGSVLFSV